MIWRIYDLKTEQNIDIKEDLDDIVSYLFEKRFNVPFVWNTYSLYDEKRAFIRGIEQKYFDNKLDVFHLYTRDYDFKRWLLAKNREQIDKEYAEDVNEENQGW